MTLRQESRSTSHSVAAIVLCGGQSLRMGADKARLPFGAETMLGRVVRTAGAMGGMDRTFCVASEHQILPALPPGVRIVRDRVPHVGPLGGLSAGLTAAAGMAETAVVVTCDAPLLRLEFLRRLADGLEDQYDAVVPQDDNRLYPLTAAYRTSLAPLVEKQLAHGMRRVLDWLAMLRVREIRAAELRDVDPDLHSLLNCNRESDYRRALVLAAISQSSPAELPRKD